MPERWVNAVVTLKTPLDVSPDASDYEKQEAVAGFLEKVSDVFNDERNVVMRGDWEIMEAEDPGPPPTIPNPPAYGAM